MYATRDDMVMQFGETECIALSDRDFKLRLTTTC